MQFQLKIQTLLLFLLIFLNINIFPSALSPMEEAQNITETLANFQKGFELMSEKNQLDNVNSLINNITPAIRVLEEKIQPLLDDTNQLGLYFKEVIYNVALIETDQYKFFIDPLEFINPLEIKFTEKYPDVLDKTIIKASHNKQFSVIFETFFQYFFFFSEYPEKIDNSYSVLKSFLANIAVFALNNRTIIENTINLIQKNVSKTYNLEPFIDGAVRLYAYEIKENQEASDNTIIFIAQHWNKINRMACEQYLDRDLSQSLIEYGIEEKQAKEISKNIKTKVIFERWWQKHKYKIIGGVTITAILGGITLLVKDKSLLWNQIKTGTNIKIKGFVDWLKSFKK